MARLKRNWSKATKGKVSQQQLVTREPRGAKKFLKDYGMPSLLWRILQSVGYPIGKEPRYLWSKELESQRPSLLPVEVVIPTMSEDATLWCGRRFIARGRNSREGANVVAYKALRDLLKRCPDEVARTFAGVFPKGDPYHLIWCQLSETTSIGGKDEAESNNGTASTALFAMMKSYSCLENVFESLNRDFLYAISAKREIKREYEEEVKRVTELFEQMTLSRDQAIQRENAAVHETFVVQSQFLELLALLGQWQQAYNTVVQQRNEAWIEKYRLRDQVFALEVINSAQQREWQWVYNQLHHNPSRAAEDGSQVVPNIGGPNAGTASGVRSMDLDHEK